MFVLKIAKNKQKETIAESSPSLQLPYTAAAAATMPFDSVKEETADAMVAPESEDFNTYSQAKSAK